MHLRVLPWCLYSSCSRWNVGDQHVPKTRLIGFSHFLDFLGFTRSARTIQVLYFTHYRILQVGLLPVCNHQQVPFAYKMYTTDDETGWKQSTAFKRAFSINVEIEFVGVWSVFDLSLLINFLALIVRITPGIPLIQWD